MSVTKANSCLIITGSSVAIILVLCCVIFLVQKSTAEIRRVTLAERLGIGQETPWVDLLEYYDCNYITTGIPMSDLLQRLSTVDEFQIRPPRVTIPFQSKDISVDLSFPVDITIVHDEFSELNRVYRVNKDGQIMSISTIPTHYGVTDIRCIP